MAKYKCQIPGESGELILKDDALGKGGEGSVFEITSHDLSKLPEASKLVGKIYHDGKDPRERARKIVSMIKKTPDTPSVAWPQALILEEGSGAFAGYVMEKLPYETYRMWAEIAHAQQRRTNAGKFDVRYALTAALNLAYTLDSVHEAGHMVGDINESNIFVGNDASVLLVDTDSAQVDKGDGTFFPCMVGKPEYTAPEISHGNLKDQKRTIETDMFGYTVALYQLLTGGAHPTDGVYTGDDEPLSVMEKQRAGILPNFREGHGYVKVKRVPTAAIPKELQNVIVRGMAVEPQSRATFEDFEEALNNVLDNLVHCKKVKTHWYDKRDKKCGWCEHIAAGQPDVWGNAAPKPNLKKKPEQKTLPAIKFGKEKEAPKPSARASQNPNTSGKASRKFGGGRGTKAPAQPQQPSGGLPELGKAYHQTYIDLPKYKGKTVLQYNDGTSSARPSFATLLSANKGKLARQCFSNELPSFLRFAWKITNYSPNIRGIAIGAGLGLILSMAWFILVPILLGMVGADKYIDEMPILQTIAHWFTIASVAIAAIGVLLTAYFGWRELRMEQKMVQYFEFYQSESMYKSVGKVALKGLIYGPFALLFFLVVFISIIVSSMMESNKNQ